MGIGDLGSDREGGRSKWSDVTRLEKGIRGGSVVVVVDLSRRQTPLPARGQLGGAGH